MYPARPHARRDDTRCNTGRHDPVRGLSHDHANPVVNHSFSEKVAQISATLNHEVTIRLTK